MWSILTAALDALVVSGVNGIERVRGSRLLNHEWHSCVVYGSSNERTGRSPSAVLLTVRGRSWTILSLASRLGSCSQCLYCRAVGSLRPSGELPSSANVPCLFRAMEHRSGV